MKSCLFCLNKTTCSKAQNFENYAIDDCSNYISKINLDNLRWNAILYDYQSTRIRKYNIFNNSQFCKDCIELFSPPNLGKETFSELLDKKAMYEFWGRCEYEFLISSWPPGPAEKPYKIDVYEQLKLNWEKFVDYLYDFYLKNMC